MPDADLVGKVLHAEAPPQQDAVLPVLREDLQSKALQSVRHAVQQRLCRGPNLSHNVGEVQR